MLPVIRIRKLNLQSNTLLWCCLVLSTLAFGQTTHADGHNKEPQKKTATQPVAQFRFDSDIRNSASTSAKAIVDGDILFVRGLDQQALRLGADGSSAFVTLEGENLRLDPKKDFSIQFWVRTTMKSTQNSVVLSQKAFANNSLAAQKNKGWVFYMSGGTWAWNMGSGQRRIAYERDNGKQMPINDGRWHQLAMTYDSVNSLIRLFYDGHNKATYNVNDSKGFDFSNGSTLR